MSGQMSQKFKLKFGPYLGGVSSVDARYAQTPHGEFSHNLLHEDGAARPRRGYRRLTNGGVPSFKAAACVAVKMFKHVTGIVSNTAYDEYLQVRRHGGSFCKLFRRDATDGGNDQVIGKAKPVDTVSLDTAGGGTYTLTFDGQTTTPLGPAASATTIKGALEALSNIAVGDVAVVVTNSIVHIYTVTWDGAYRGTSVPALTITDDTLTGGGGVHTATRTVAASDYNMADAYWDGFVYDKDVYVFNYAAGQEGGGGPFSDSEPLLRYTIGDYTSLVAIKPPATALYTDHPILVKFRRQAGNDNTTYGQLRWAGAGSATYTKDNTIFTGAAGEVTANGQQLVLAQQNNNLGVAWVQIDLTTITAGAQNFQYNDCFGFSFFLAKPGFYDFDAGSLKVYLTNTAGTSTVELDTTVYPTYVDNNPGLGLVAGLVYCKFNPTTKLSSLRANWASVKYVKIEFQPTFSTSGNTAVRFTPFTIGGIVDWGTPPSQRNEDLNGLFQLGYAYRNSTTQLRSGVSGVLVMRQDDLLGQLFNGVGSEAKWLGSIPYLTVPASAETGVDKLELYERRQLAQGDGTVVESKWHLMDTLTNTGSSVNETFGFTGQDFDFATEYTVGDFDYNDIVAAVPLYGSVLYMYRDRTVNLRWSEVGFLTVLANLDGSNVDVTDVFRAANFQLTADDSDTPVGAVGAGGVTFILGQRGLYYQIGSRPSSMTPVRTVNGAPGCLGRHSYCAWKDETGASGLAYVSADGAQVWFFSAASVTSDAANSVGRMLTDEDRRSVESHLYQRNPSVDPNVATLAIDQISDALWFQYSFRAMVDRRPSLIDARRYWEHYAYGNQANGSWSGTGWTLASFDQVRGIRLTAPTGYIDELERDSSNNNAVIGGEDAQPDSTDVSADTVTFKEDPEWPLGLALDGLLTIDRLDLKTATAGTYKLNFGGQLTTALGPNATAATVQSALEALSNVAPGDVTVTLTDAIVRKYDVSWNGGAYLGTTVPSLVLSTNTLSGGTGVATLARDTSTVYYVRPTVLGTYQFHPTLADAQDNTNKVDLTTTVTVVLSPLGRDNGNDVASGTLYWKSPVVKPGHECAALRTEVFRRRLTSQPSVTLWANRNPETTARQVAQQHRKVRHFPTTQGSEFQVRLDLQANSDPIFFVDCELSVKSVRALL